MGSFQNHRIYPGNFNKLKMFFNILSYHLSVIINKFFLIKIFIININSYNHFLCFSESTSHFLFVLQNSKCP